MSNRRRSRGKNRSNASQTDRSNKKHKRPVLSVPKEFNDGVILFDEDEFYGVFLDLLLDSLNNATLMHVNSMKDFESFKNNVSVGKFNRNIYVIDELFGWGSIDLPQLISNIRIIDKEAHIIGCTAMNDGELVNAELYDNIVAKGKGNNERTMAKALAEFMGVELKIDNSDPEYNNF